MANWNSSALAIMVAPIRVVCSDGWRFRAAATPASTCGLSENALARLLLTAATESSITVAADSTTRSLVVSCSHSPARSATVPVSHPSDGNHDWPAAAP